jgi:hypothetical protein
MHNAVHQPLGLLERSVGIVVKALGRYKVFILEKARMRGCGGVRFDGILLPYFWIITLALRNISKRLNTAKTPASMGGLQDVPQSPIVLFHAWARMHGCIGEDAWTRLDGCRCKSSEL